MYSLTKTNFLKKDLFNFLIAIFPLSFIAGNMIININLLLIILLSILIFRKDLFKLRFFFLDKIIFFLFLFIIFTGLINDYYFFIEELSWKGYFATTIKSILFLKYLLLYIVVRFLVEKNIIDLKLFFIFSSLAVIFVSLDIFYQFIFGKDIFGFEAVAKTRKLAGPFGDELIAGSFIQRFSIFSFFLLPLFFPEKSKILSKYLLPILFIIIFFGIILSGNRMPILLFLLTIFLLILFNPQTRKFFFPFLIISTILFSLILNLNQSVKNNFDNFYSQISKMTFIVITKDFNSDNAPQYFKEFETFYNTWLMNKYIGGGIKNFRYYCHERSNIKSNSKFICNMHPHNYYLEILTETGVVGLILVFCIFIYILYLTLVRKYFIKNLNDNLIVPFIFLFIAEIFPIKSTGSFFTTGNSTYLFLIIGIMIGLIRKNNLIENKI